LVFAFLQIKKFWVATVSMTWTFNHKSLVIILAVFVSCSPMVSSADQTDSEPEESAVSSDLPLETVPEPDEEEEKTGFLKKMPKGLLIVPIPTSTPTFGTGLILGGAYYYPQTDEQKEAQPASFTGAAAAYTSNDSWAAGVMQQNYWKEDTWRFTGFAGYLDLKLDLNASGSGDDSAGRLDWLVSGPAVQGRISRRLRGNWYLGVTARYLDISQSLVSDEEGDGDFNISSDITAVAVGLNLDYDSRDLPSNAFQGRYLELKALTSNQSNSNDDTYQSYHARFRSYHPLRDSLVFAWEVNGCARGGEVPLWDTCRLGLRGFSATQYLGKRSLYAQAEVRWRIYKRWGLVGFAGAGRVYETFESLGEGNTVPSYGLGIRFMVLESQRINLRIDYARSDQGNEAWYLSVSEAF
jgi:hypothetical protein